MDSHGAHAGLDSLRSGEDDSGALRAAGRRWSGAVGKRREWDQALPVDPELSRVPAEADARGLRRFVSVDFAPHGTREVEATEAAYDPVTAGARLGSRLLRAVLGPPLRTTAIAHERMRKLVALPVLSADALSSVAYGPEALLAVLVLGGSAGLGFALPVAAQLVRRILSLLERLGHERGRRVVLVVECPPCQLQRDHRVDQACLLYTSPSPRDRS